MVKLKQSEHAAASSSFSARAESMLMRNLNSYVTLSNEIVDFFNGTFFCQVRWRRMIQQQ